ncbi:MAG TPA: pyridoxine 5'-phosphate synthase [Bacteroidales bacterium]|nr:MAG: Pyridoxine 5'-phosphate synthase [Bacteroidetes bacterium ADurb.Bin217]HPH16747.1 pyridoxine 5'-phosphate synthase [Bacteroidales bacterium]HPM13532.1 pyridoxine 5'-phosphate synthase [Bacteroidales bacterium]
MTVLSVNINKIALIRNSRGANNPNILSIAKDCERFGAHGITIHPRPDQRHARYQDVFELKQILSTELNIEGYPDARFLDVVCKAKPSQVTLVPDAPDALTSNSGWNTQTHQSMLTEITQQLQSHGIRVSIFVNPEELFIEYAAKIGCNRIELYTEPYAAQYFTNRDKAVEPYVRSSAYAHELGLEVNAGHDLNLDNLAFFKHSLPVLHEVSIGHALVCDALYMGLEKTIEAYLQCL